MNDFIRTCVENDVDPQPVVQLMKDHTEKVGKLSLQTERLRTTIHLIRDKRRNQPITVRAVYGLCNRLRATLSCVHLARSLQVPLVVCWTDDEVCPGVFEDYFQTLPGVTFIPAPPRPGFQFDFDELWDVLDGFLPDWTILKLNDRMEAKLRDTIAGVPKGYAASHIRKTDHTALFTKSLADRGIVPKTDEGYISFARRHKSIWLAADCQETQNMMKSFDFEVHCLPIEPSSQLRQTSIEQAILDLYMCVRATAFLGSTWSSFTQTIEALRLIKEIDLFWQYPACTEKAFCDQNQEDPEYMGVPWATVIDKKYPLQSVFDMVSKAFPRSKRGYYTCCQHIHFRRLFPLFKGLGVHTVYSPHKVKGENSLTGIRIVACPLFAVNIEDPKRNALFRPSSPSTMPDRDLLYSFVGGHQEGYISDIRKRIFDLSARSDVLIEHTGRWHFNSIVYSDRQNKARDETMDEGHMERTLNYNRTLLRSRYSLCPSGSGPNSIRLWESLAAGSIPVVLADTLDLPKHKLWRDAAVFLKEADLGGIDAVLAKITPKREELMRRSCAKLYRHFRESYRG